MYSFYKRVLRRLWNEKQRVEYRLNSRIPQLGPIAALNHISTVKDRGVSASIGNPALVSSYASAFRDPDEPSKALLNHKLCIFSEHYYDLNATKIDAGRITKLHSAALELPEALVKNYRPIDWCRDFRSGFEWSNEFFFFDRELAPRRGSDVKFPWELSKFVHLGLMIRSGSFNGAHEFILQCLDWITSNPRFKGIGWTSELVVAIRAINWIWGLNIFRDEIVRYRKALEIIEVSLYDHYLYLQRHLAYNEVRTDDHFLGDLVGLLHICSAFPHFPHSDEWLLFSIRGLCSEMSRQVLSDGYSHMMSTHYHSFVAELFATGAAVAERLPIERRALCRKKTAASAWPWVSYVDSIRVLDENSPNVLPDDFYSQLIKMGEVIEGLSKPDGRLPQFGDNDSARLLCFDQSTEIRTTHRGNVVELISSLINADNHGSNDIPPRQCQVIAGGLDLKPSKRATKFKSTSRADLFFEDAQLAVLKNSNFHVAICCSRNGYPNNEGGHGHNDKLSFELSVGLDDFIVDGGCPFYTSDPTERNRYRSTTAHNTLVLSGQEQDELPANLFRLPGHSQPKLRFISSTRIEGQHVGYGLPHKREFLLLKNSFLIKDDFKSEEKRFLNFNLHPNIHIADLKDANNKKVTLRLKSQTGVGLLMSAEGVTHAEIFSGAFGEGYGIPRKNKRIALWIAKEERRVTTKFSLVIESLLAT